MRNLVIIITIFTLIGCKKPDPNPELKDPIYNDLNAMLEEATKSFEGEKKTFEGYKKDLEDVVPQSGQIKIARQHLEDSRTKLTLLEQEKQYLELKVSARSREAKRSYKIAFDKQLPWPDPEEWRLYEIQKKFRAAKKTWDVKSRIKELSPQAEKSKAAAAGAHH